ncbi:hypothetical protein NZ47_02705 [Anaerovibrio lipolyticus]|uniref:Uncharacterized protein n=1 Tax=Anaerovibrio lipolyticus TaxID=82374 RepID=A0A0B2JWU6_9FIRM|nr:hypothetical protein [Anaerovibrio lipolyticus]KHM52765.1 hypothetical protein NZ47_02705 [Anaerovibrio lipolyticus]
MAKFEIKMIFKKSANMASLHNEITNICNKTGNAILHEEGNVITYGSDSFNTFAPAFVHLIYSSILKNSLLDAIWKDYHGEHSCKKSIMEPIA